MNLRNCVVGLVALIVLPLGSVAVAQTRYNYGGKPSYGETEGGFVLSLEAGLANPRNTDNIVAAVGPNVIIPQWDDEPAGRLGFGYRWSNGSIVSITVWSFEAEQDAADSLPSPAFEFPIGPASGSSFAVETKVSAFTTDAAWGITHQVNESLSVGGSIGLRYASFEETTDGVYDGVLTAAKSLEGNMLGARLVGRARYRVGSFSASVAAGYSALDGELEQRSSLTQADGSPAPGTSALLLIDDSRSGTILDLDVTGAWHSSGDAVSVWIGWEQQEWADIAADLTRNLPGSGVISRDRDSVTFSWFKVGVSYRF